MASSGGISMGFLREAVEKVAAFLLDKAQVKAEVA